MDRTKRLSAIALAMAIGLVVLTPTTPAGAATPPETPAEKSASADNAETHVQHGIALRAQLRDIEALAEFHTAYGIDPAPRTRAQIALAEQALGHWSAAESDLKAALQSTDPWIASHRQALEQSLGFVETHLGWLEIVSNVQGAEVTIDGNVVGHTPLPGPARVSIGTALVHLEADGYLAMERTISIDPGAHARELVELVPRRAPGGSNGGDPPVVATGEPNGREQVASIAAPPPASMSKKASVEKWTGVGLIAGGVAAIGVGTVFGIRTYSNKSARDEHCDANRCDAIGLQFDRDARHDATISSIAFGAGALLAVGGGLLVWHAYSGVEARITPTAGPHSASIGLSGNW